MANDLPKTRSATVGYRPYIKDLHKLQAIQDAYELPRRSKALERAVDITFWLVSKAESGSKLELDGIDISHWLKK